MRVVRVQVAHTTLFVVVDIVTIRTNVHRREMSVLRAGALVDAGVTVYTVEISMVIMCEYNVAAGSVKFRSDPKERPCGQNRRQANNPRRAQRHFCRPRFVLTDKSFAIRSRKRPSSLYTALRMY